MGMFDRLYLTCKCGSKIEFQTKSGPCELAEYRANDFIPVDIAMGLQGQTEACDSCGKKYHIHKPPMPETVRLNIEEMCE